MGAHRGRQAWSHWKATKTDEMIALRKGLQRHAIRRIARKRCRPYPGGKPTGARGIQHLNRVAEDRAGLGGAGEVDADSVGGDRIADDR